MLGYHHLYSPHSKRIFTPLFQLSTEKRCCSISRNIAANPNSSSFGTINTNGDNILLIEMGRDDQSYCLGISEEWNVFWICHARLSPPLSHLDKNLDLWGHLQQWFFLNLSILCECWDSIRWLYYEYYACQWFINVLAGMVHNVDII